MAINGQYITEQVRVLSAANGLNSVVVGLPRPNNIDYQHGGDTLGHCRIQIGSVR